MLLHLFTSRWKGTTKLFYLVFNASGINLCLLLERERERDHQLINQSCNKNTELQEVDKNTLLLYLVLEINFLEATHTESCLSLSEVKWSLCHPFCLHTSQYFGSVQTLVECNFGREAVLSFIFYLLLMATVDSSGR